MNSSPWPFSAIALAAHLSRSRSRTWASNLFFPILATTLAQHATQLRVRSRVLPVALESDLLRLKKIARANRSSPGDAEDIAFLEARRARRR